MDYRMEVHPRYAMKWDGGTVYFEPPEGELVALVAGKPRGLRDLARALGDFHQIRTAFSLKHIPELLRLSPFRLVQKGDTYQIAERIGATVDGIADNFLKGKSDV